MLTTDLDIKGYFPGVLGKITESHATYYWKHWNFDISFEIQVAHELADFLRNFDPGIDGFWAVTRGSDFCGAVAVDGHYIAEQAARLRWFIVEEKYQGAGIGRILIQKAVEFSRLSGHQRIYLWTFKGLDSARHLYEASGFKMSVEHVVDQWGSNITEQKFELELPNPSSNISST